MDERRAAIGIALFLLVMGVFTATEIFWRRDSLTITQRARGFQIWAVMLLWWGVAAGATYQVLRALGLQSMVKADLYFHWAGWLAVPIATFAAFLWKDFWFYWFHRAQHRFLWRWHSVHHSVENLSAVNSYHHWSEPIFWQVGVALPMTLIDFGFYPETFAVSFIFAAQSTYIHSSSGLHFGRFGSVMIDNRYHRIHHSLEERHFDKNFGAMTTLWDRLFGTHYRPNDNEWPATGVAGLREPRNLWQWATMPIRLSPSQTTNRLIES